MEIIINQGVSMAYTTNPKLPKLRAKACQMVQEGKTVSEVARHFGFSKGAVSKWLKRYPEGGASEIPTKSSRPKSHPRSLKTEIIESIVSKRLKRGRCAEYIHKELSIEGIKVSASSVKRILYRRNLINRKKYRYQIIPVHRPEVAYSGDLVQIDTIHLIGEKGRRLYIYTLLDVYSRWAYALASYAANNRMSLEFIRKARVKIPFKIRMLQSDNGSEFSRNFSQRIRLAHRHSRVRRPNDNAHLERFNRTLKEELLYRLPKDVRAINKALPKYLKHYNEERFHFGLDFLTPIQKCFQAID
ncbi:MAG: hypothetical protein A3J48_04255 [Candidatus Doudnabacteria bacterium RIFCSPHIGHO2_02_FULL_46_11]|uniref:Integrase catalytic domain-containing protein n=1 Tax=Candidatus Doudnabacteria bacterium RIFCSPHIGHO2_02_FULL_46_11 TaxID=1817832 RepID=A0A1F5P4F1_9BACT|nr:MAG: hypothetical protein A3J48_04255 [Candidatus Doudnabacteria bacterium RIFCSPHIGHO2_02_FULL_46_11]